MGVFFQTILAIIIFCPLILLAIVYAVAKKLGASSQRAFGYGADSMTLLLFFSLSLAVQAIWNVQVIVYIVLVMMLIAIVISYKEWRTKKEIEIGFVFRKLWRISFLVLTCSYIGVLLVGLILNIIEFSTV